MLKKFTRGHRWLAVPVALVAAAGFATQSGALSSTSHTMHVCSRLDARETTISAELAAEPAKTRAADPNGDARQIAQIETAEAQNSCTGG